MEELFQKFKKQFISEILGLLEQLENELLLLENEPQNQQLIDSVFRAMHTIKGTSGMYGNKHISDLTHHLESIFQSVRDSEAPITKNIIDISLVSLDHIRRLVDDEDLVNLENITKQEELLNKIKSCLKEQQDVVVSYISTSTVTQPDQTIHIRTWHILIRTDEKIFFRGISILGILTDLASLGTFRMHRISSLSDKNTETWGIILISGASLDTIKEVFMFIEDYCSFVLIKDGNLLNQNSDPVKNAVNPESQEIQLNIFSPDSEKENIETDPLIKDNDENYPKESGNEETFKKQTAVPTLPKYNLKHISVDTTKLDYLMYLVSELITLNSQLLQTTKDDYYENIRPQIEQMEGLAKLFRNSALEIRLVPLGNLALRFQRLVRDLSRQLNKEIEFVTIGTDIELDKNTIDLIAEPIIHLIRNCIDHGIESPADRIAKDKPETGTITLSAKHVGSFIHIKVEDNGKGLDLDKIRGKAIHKGIIKNNETLTKSELTNLIFHPGFSTAENITEVSGRGVGMDVVRKKITELHGEILVDTEKDRGTSFTLKIQQSIAIIDTLLFRVEESYFILPLVEIEICIHTDRTSLFKNQNTSTLDHNNTMIPYLNLRSVFNLGGSYPDMIKTIILKEAGQYIALLCDEIIGEQQAVLKPIGQVFSNETEILAVSQHGNGKWAYMLNTNFLYQRLKLQTINK
jgi:two-component system, chemotaxis family, sensor kinase CheA